VPPTPSATATPGLCESDFDCDGFDDTGELFMGTNPFAACALTTTANDELIDPHPSDTNDDGRFNTMDTVGFAVHLNTVIGTDEYSDRVDLDANGRVNTLDLVPLSLKFNTTCG
jgi:hypothetical protein